MTYQQLLAELQRLKGSGAWQKLATGAGIDYFTVARIARGEIADPGVKTVEKIVAAMEKLSTPQA